MPRAGGETYGRGRKNPSNRVSKGRVRNRIKMNMRTTSFFLLGICAAMSAVGVGAAELRTPEQRFSNITQAEQPSFRRHVVPLISVEGETTQCPYERDPEFIGLAEFRSGARI